MMQSWKASLTKLIVHRVGNKVLDDGVIISNKMVDLKGKEDLYRILMNYFLSQFREPVYYRFHHVSSLELNEVYTIVEKIFDLKTSFSNKSKDLANILYEYSNHPKIKSGELYVVYFEGFQLEDELIDAIGIFKSENRETFLKVFLEEKNFEIEYEDGLSIAKLDKGCLVFNLEKEEGYKVALVDNLGKGGDAQYWKDEFLKVKPLADNFHQTKNYLQLAKNFVIEKLDDEFEISKTEKINYLNRSIEYFKDNEDFNEKEFAKKVFEDTAVIKSFRNFKNEFQNENDIEITDDFSISHSAVKKQQRVFKSVLKLDKNFDIHIHGNNDLIQKGMEKDGRKFYKIYYDKEN